METRLTRRAAAARLVGVLAAVTTAIVLWFVALPLFISWSGLMIAGVIAFGIGTVAATLIDPQWERRNAGVVVFAVLVLAAFYVLVLTRLPPYENLHRSEGGPALLPPR
jgi:uncharacterized PurR-regulated membrane protein YhhQ (DUF165 family)